MSHLVLGCLLILTMNLPLMDSGYHHGNTIASSAIQTPDRALLQAVVEQFFAAFARKDAKTLMTLWSETSPSAASSRKRFEEAFDASAGQEFAIANIGISKEQIEGNTARLRTAISLTIADTESKEQRTEKRFQNFAFVKEDNKWRIWRYATVADDIADALIEAKTDQERNDLLQQEAELPTASLLGALGRRGQALFYQGEFSKAMAAFQVEHTIACQKGFNDICGGTLNAIGNVYNIQGNYRRAMETYNTVLAMTIDEGLIASVLNDRAIIYALHRNYDQALSDLQKSVSIDETLEKKESAPGKKNDLVYERAMAVDNIGNVHELQGKLEEALEDHKKSYELRKRLLEEDQERKDQSKVNRDKHSIGQSLDNMAIVYGKQQKYADAAEHNRQSLAIYEELKYYPSVGNVLNSLASLDYLLGNYSESLERAQRAAELSANVPEVRFRALNTAGKAFRALKEPSKARQAFLDSVSVVETLRNYSAGNELDRQRLFENKVAPYKGLVEMAVTQDSKEALRYAELAKARVLVDVLRAAKEDKTSGKDLEELVPEEIIKLLPDASALLEFVVAEDKTYLFVLTIKQAKTRESQLKAGKNNLNGAADLRIYPIEIKQKELSDRVVNFRDKIAKSDPPDPDYVAEAKGLYKLLLTPAKDQIAGKTLLVIIPDETLWDLPFQVLMPPDEASSKSKPSSSRYLIQESAVYYAPSIHALGLMMQGRANNPQALYQNKLFLGLGNPVLGKEVIEATRRIMVGADLKELPAAAGLLKGLRRYVYGITQSDIYLSEEASEARFKKEAANYRLLQLATHGILNNVDPIRSYLILSRSADGKEDGMLEAEEMMKLTVNADLVVLSACDTARGRVGAGEGVIGMTWALFIAGCPRAVVSQWKVDSSSTAKLMMSFHRNLKPRLVARGRELGVARALQQAIKEILNNPSYKHPFFWGGFIVMGDGK